jgi:hypothetical protein
VWVTFPGTEPNDQPNGKILHISSVADAASDTLQCRVEVPNPDKRPAGERVLVQFTQPAPVPMDTDQTAREVSLRETNDKIKLGSN